VRYRKDEEPFQIKYAVKFGGGDDAVSYVGHSAIEAEGRTASGSSGSGGTGQLEAPTTPPADSALYRFLVANKSYDVERQRKQRLAAIQLVSQACKEVIEKNCNSRVNCEVLHLLGSCQMGVQSADSDVDALCVGPDTMSCSRVHATPIIFYAFPLLCTSELTRRPASMGDMCTSS
jgi:hypothetical protein